MPAAQTLAERAAGPLIEDCPVEEFDPETDSTTTTSSTILNPLLVGSCPDEDDDEATTETTLATGLVD
jgi:hypothetical protein